MQYYASMQELIGHTPLVALTHLGFPAGVRVFAKLELWNPAGSAKDRVGRAMLDAAEASGRLRPGGTVVEGTAGNTGLGIAFAALNRGYRVIFVVPEKFSSEKQTLMRALGAEIVHTPRVGGMQAAAARAREIAAGIPGAITLEQFRNPANPGAHYRTTGPEIYQALDGRVDYLVSGAGSGGTFTGILRYLKEQDPVVRGVLADPYGSIIGGGEHGAYEIEGIGNDFIAETMDMGLVDAVYKIHDEEAFAAVRTLARKEGILAGSSSGAALAAAQKLAADGARGNIVVPIIDRAERYFSKHLLEESAGEPIAAAQEDAAAG
ncbi:MAG: cysteine synthase family protein [Selenomonadaceae bacterium]|uniref:PLP-dependent cysteine synthase family protein n=1 Tax=Selenomonas bovis TaxID=416586 RepID=UPI0006918003|nr:cysteine synthase family protein [Selenomonas bovis]MDY6272967.1 cysteine synthase family protein [Selenomonadaceae bacterium]MDY6298434.1 cysteine synthase family protein [Selenomonadaceae bacterium]